MDDGSTRAVLAQPTRARIAELLARAPDGLGVGDLADALSLHPNTVRQHLAAMARAGVVASERAEPSGRGRPGARYRLVAGGVAEASAQRELMSLLVDLITDAAIPESSAEKVGRAHGRRMATDSPAIALADMLAGLGFAPEEVTAPADRGAGRTELVLHHCPFRSAVEQPGGHVVCLLHKGLAEGMAEAGTPPSRVSTFTIEEPAEAGCRLVVEGG